MGAGNFLTYLLGGVADSAENLRKKNEAQAQLDQEEQKSVYKILLQSPDPKIQSLGLTGLLEPPKKSPFGNLKKSPTYMQALDLVHRGQTGQPAPPDAATTPPNPEVAAPTPPPPVPMSGAMPDVPPMTGGGGKTGPAPPSPVSAAPAPPPMPPPPLAAAAVQQGPHPEKVVHDFLSGFRSPQEAMQWVESQERGQIFAKPELHPLKVALTNAIGSGGTMEDVKDQLLPNRLKFAMGAAKQHWQGKPIPAEAIPPGALDMGGNPLVIEKGKTYLPTLLPGDTTPRYSLGAPAPQKNAKILYHTVGNKQVAAAYDPVTMEMIKDNISAKEMALGQLVHHNQDGTDTTVLFSKMPGGGGPPSAPSSLSGETTPPPEGPLGDHPRGGLEQGAKPIAGQERTRAQAGNAALESSVQIQQMLKDPKVAAALGPLEGRKVTFEQLLGTIPEDMTKLRSALDGYALNVMGVHGMRSAQEAHELINKNLPLKFNSRALVGSLEGLNEVPTSWASKLPPPPKEQRVVGRTVMVIKAGPDAGKVGVWQGPDVGWVPWTP